MLEIQVKMHLLDWDVYFAHYKAKTNSSAPSLSLHFLKEYILLGLSVIFFINFLLTIPIEYFFQTQNWHYHQYSTDIALWNFTVKIYQFNPMLCNPKSDLMAQWNIDALPSGQFHSDKCQHKTCAGQYSAVQYSAVQCSTVQCRAVQCTTVQCRAVQWCKD